MKIDSPIKWQAEFSPDALPDFTPLEPLDNSGKQWRVYQMSVMENRFLIVDENTRPFEPTSEQIIAFADKSPKWDQLLTTKVINEKQITTRVWNCDGSRAENCGNGVRCLAALQLFRQQGFRQASNTKQIDPRILDERQQQGSNLSFIFSNLDVSLEGVESSTPLHTRCWPRRFNKTSHWNSQRVYAFIDHRAIKHLKIDTFTNNLIKKKIPDVKFLMQVCYGNPHLVLFFDSGNALKQAIAKAEDEKLEDALRNSPSEFYRKGVNINFAHINHEKQTRTERAAKQVKAIKAHIDLKTLERGAGWTGSCGSGAAATWYAARQQDLKDLQNVAQEKPDTHHSLMIKPLGIPEDLIEGDQGTWDRNAFHVSLSKSDFNILGFSQIERAGMLTL